MGTLLLLGGCTGGASSPDGERTTGPAASDPVDEPIEIPEPCSAGVTIDLGYPFRGQEVAVFQAAGGTVHVTVRQFPHGGVLDPEVWRSGVYLGHADDPPTYDEQSGRVSNVVTQTSVVEGTWSAVELEAGRYWLWATNGGDVAVRSCEPDGVSDPSPAQVVDPRGRSTMAP